MNSEENIFYLHKMGLTVEQIARLIGESEEMVKATLFWPDRHNEAMKALEGYSFKAEYPSNFFV